MADKYGKNLNKKYLFSVVGIIALTICAMLYLLARDYQYHVRELENEAHDQAHRITVETDRYFEKYRDIVLAVAQSDCFKQKALQSCNRFFERLNELFPIAENFAIIDGKGDFIASGQSFDSNDPPNLFKSPIFQALKSGASVYVMDPIVGPISGERVVAIAIPLLDLGGEFDGIFGVSLSIKEIEGLWRGLLTKLSINVFILNRNNQLMAASQSAKQLLNEKKLTIDQLVNTLGENDEAQLTIGSNEFRLRMVLSKPSQWKIVSLVPQFLSLESYMKKNIYSLLIGSVTIFLLLVMSIVLIRDSLMRARLKKAESRLESSRKELQALAALDKSEQSYQELFQNAPVGLWEEDFTQAIAHIERIIKSGVDDLDAYFVSHPEELREIAAKVVILDVNKASLMMHQAESKKQLLGSLDRLFTERSYAVFKQELIALVEGKSHIELQGEVRTLRDETRTIVVRVYRLGTEGDYGRILIATSDITQLTQTEEALRRSQKMDAIGQITGGIAHDFNNILGIIIGNLDLLKLQVSADEKSFKRVNTALGAAMRAADLTRQLLGFSRQQAQESEPTDLNETVREMRSLITRSVTPAIDVEYRQSENLWPVSINPGDFKDSLLNLVLNAKDAMPDGGKIIIQTVNRTLTGSLPRKGAGPYPGDYVVLKISDTGCGIPADLIDHIFEPFYTSKPPGKGTGLGLSMVFGFVKRSKGDVRAESSPGKGTTISLLLPRVNAIPKRPESATTEDAAPQEVNETILVVDDEKELLELAANHLEKCGYKIIGAGSGQEALQRLEQNPAVDLLFTDIVMPGGMSGYELAETAIRKYPHLKVLFTSGFTKQAERTQSKFPASQPLGKPYSQAELSCRLRQLLDS